METFSAFQGRQIEMSEAAVSRLPRKDAQHNRAHILDVARQAFIAAGVDIPMDAIATQAGVGPGTLYRHFASKDVLLAALLNEHYEDLERQRRLIEAEETSPDRILERWMDALGDWMTVYDGLPEPLRAGWSRSDSPLKPTCKSVIETTERILREAQAIGAARGALSGRDIFLAALAIAWAASASTAEAGTRDALRDVVRNGWAETDE